MASTEQFHGDFGRQIGAMKVLEDRVAEVERTYAGRPQPEVQAALEEAISGAGAQPDPIRVAEQAQQISNAKG
jgi:hypothetical protein